MDLQCVLIEPFLIFFIFQVISPKQHQKKKKDKEKKVAIGLIFVLDSCLPFITEMHLKQVCNLHSKFNIKISNLLTTQSMMLPTIATGNISKP